MMTEPLWWRLSAGRRFAQGPANLRFEKRTRFLFVGETMIRHASPSRTVTATSVRDHVELPDSTRELPYACRGGLLARRFRCNRSGRDRTPYRQEPESGSDHTETTCKTLHRHSETH